jgi:hypothetical protein
MDDLIHRAFLPVMDDQAFIEDSGGASVRRVIIANGKVAEVMSRLAGSTG